MKKVNIILIISILFSISIKAQKNYSILSADAIKIVRTKDSIHYNVALNLFEKAFNNFPDSIDDDGLYYSSIVADRLKENNETYKYLAKLSSLETDDEGNPGWSYILDEYAKDDYANLMTDKRWDILKQKALRNKEKYFEKLYEAEKEFFNTSNINLEKHASAENLYNSIKDYHPFLQKKQQDYSIPIKLNDTTETSYLVHLPKNYTPDKKYPALIFLHGAVRYSSLTEYQIPQKVLGGWNRYYTKYASLNNVILIFPSANKKYNWMTTDDGFFMIPKIVNQLKTAINIDDNQIFISGHSNGSTGSFSYAMKQPTQFAGFYGFNTQPKVYTGGTFIENILNRSYINFSTDKDYYYPPNANDSLDSLMKSINADYKDFRYYGFPHWFPKFDESEPAYKILFSDLMKRKRNPFPKKINWEFDDNKYGNIDWLTNIKLDTLQQKRPWQKHLNFKISKWLKYDKNDSLVVVDVNKKAFDFPRNSGKIIAEYKNNVFKLKTSRIKSLSINISPEMVNLRKKIKIYINGKLYFNKRIKYNKEFMLKNFEKNHDRKQIWINFIELKV